MGSRQSFATPHSRVPSAMIGQYTLKPDTHSNRDTGINRDDGIVYFHMSQSTLLHDDAMLHSVQLHRIFDVTHCLIGDPPYYLPHNIIPSDD